MERACYTYFYVAFGEDFDLKDFCAQLGLSYEKTLKCVHKNSLKLGRNDEFNIDINEMVRVTLKDLFGKEEILLSLKEKYALEYYLERVPTLEADSERPNQCLSLDFDIIEFLYKTRTRDDLDYYV